jgi:beta-lactamase class A
MYLGGERKLYIHSTARSGSDGVTFNSFLPGDPIYRQDLHEGILEVASLF